MILNENDKILRKRDLISGFIIVDLVAIIVLVIVWRGGDNTQIVNQFSLGASISSIFLALVAIIYAFFQSNASSNQNTLVHSALNKIIDKVEEFASIKGELESFQESSKSDISNIFSAIENLDSKSIEKSLKEQKVDIPEIVQEAISKYENDMRMGLSSLEEKISRLNTFSPNTSSRKTKTSPVFLYTIRYQNDPENKIEDFLRKMYPFLNIFKSASSSSINILDVPSNVSLTNEFKRTLQDMFPDKIISISSVVIK